MSSREVFDCDRCAAEDIGADGTFSFVIGREMGPAGSSEDICDSVDLCPKCIRTVLTNAVKHGEQRLPFDAKLFFKSAKRQ